MNRTEIDLDGPNESTGSGPSALPNLPETCRAAVFHPETRRLTLTRVKMTPPGPGEAIVRVACSAICGSDLHTYEGRRIPEKPLILGHETCGVVVRLGTGLERDSAGKSLAPGDRITWSLGAHCGHCFPCSDGVPQKCTRLFKYGHESMDVLPRLNGGFAEYLHLAAGSTLYRLPDDLGFNETVFANCALATVAAAQRTADLQNGDAVLIQGAGLLGLCAAAMASTAGCRAVLVTDTNAERLAMAEVFGATHTCLIGEGGSDLDAVAREVAGPYGFDAAIEVCGQPAAVADGIRALKIGGRYVLAGCVFPGALAEIDLQTVTTRLLCLRGLHNYTPRDLLAALRFLQRFQHRFPFSHVVGKTFPLERIEDAFAYAIRNRNVLRVAIQPFR